MQKETVNLQGKAVKFILGMGTKTGTVVWDNGVSIKAEMPNGAVIKRHIYKHDVICQEHNETDKALL
jgi:hypothetical protein